MAESTAGSANLHNSHNNGVVVGVNLGTIIYGRRPDEVERDHLVQYLMQVTRSHSTMLVVGLGSARLDAGLDLASVYMMLAIQGRQRVVRPLTAQELADYQRRAFDIPDNLSNKSCLPDQAILAVDTDPDSGMVSLFRAELATETVLDHQHLVLCGAPGSGKSTFAHHLVWAFAQRGLDQINQHTGLLGWHAKQRLLPVFMPLRRLAGDLVGKDLGLHDLASMGLFVNIVCAYLHQQYALEEPRTLLLAGLARRLKVLFVLDGLDEVPLEATDKSLDRDSLLRFVRRCANCLPNARMVITCRSRAWTQDYSHRTHWPMVELAPLTDGQMRIFISDWFPQLHAKGVIEYAAIAQHRERLVESLSDPKRQRLRAMAENPLLLSMMIFVMAETGKLPHDRSRLYEQILDQLLEQWDAKRAGQNLGHVIGDERVTGKKLRDFVLDRLCYEAHRDTTSRDGRGRIDALMLKHALMDYFAKIKIKTNDPYWAAERCITYIDQRSGLVQPDDTGQVYTFAHLTLQEHSAGRHLLTEELLQETLAVRHDDRWREPIFLGVGCLADEKIGPSKISEFLTALISPYEFRSKPRTWKHQYIWYRDLVLAAELGVECDWDMLNGANINVAAFQDELQAGLATLLNDYDHAQAALAYYEGHAMEPVPLLLQERQKAAELLAGLGDPRYPVSITQWQAETRQLSKRFGREGTHYWRYIPGGRYEIGGWDQEHPPTAVALQPYWIGRFTVTIEQYYAFRFGEDYANDIWWTREGLAYKQINEAISKDVWGHYPKIDRQFLNIPASNELNLEEIMAYCNWLTHRLGSLLPTGYRVYLPSPAEWEVAATHSAKSKRDTFPWDERLFTHIERDYAQSPRRLVGVGVGLLGHSACGILDSVGFLRELLDVGPLSDVDGTNSLIADTHNKIVRDRHAYYDDDHPFITTPHLGDDIDVPIISPYYNEQGGMVHRFRCVIAHRP